MRQQQPKFPTTSADDHHSNKKGNNNQAYPQEPEPVMLDYERALQQSRGTLDHNSEYSPVANPYDRQGSPSTPSQHSLLTHQVNLNSQQCSPVGHSTEILSYPYTNRDQQQYSLERAAQKPRMMNDRPNASKSMDQFSVPSIQTYSPQGVAMNEPIIVDTYTESSSPPPVPPHQSPSALEETARKARVREQKTVQPAKRRERSFFEEIRQRLSRGSSKIGRKRAKSLDEQNPELEEAVSVPPSRDNSTTRDQTQVRLLTGPKYSAQYPETSTIDSQPSGRLWKDNTYSDGPSQLILELDNNIDGGENANGKRYYLIPPEIMSEPAAIRLMHNGKKLHVHNNHTFVAVKPRGRVMCNAYQCRDCRKVSHKSCHQRSSSPCQHSNLSNIMIIEDVDWVDFLRQYQLEESICMNGL
uniref:Phorbol-ester/DAG-type domain-containing protein n=1 Tax=Ditylenchus dipsaci TaxID=166011 RepID=A0A915ED83_9BILA